MRKSKRRKGKEMRKDKIRVNTRNGVWLRMKKAKGENKMDGENIVVNEKEINIK